MELRSFLHAGYALLVEAWMGAGQNLLTAIESVDASIRLTTPQEVAVQNAERVPTAADNTRAMAELQKMMGGL